MRITRTEWFDDRYYKVHLEGGKSLFCPSVTTKLSVVKKPFLEKWRGEIGNKMADQIMSKAADRGSRLHYCWEVINRGGAVLYNPKRNPQFSVKDIAYLQKKYKGDLVSLEDQDEQFEVFKMTKWLKIAKPKVIETELIVYDLKHKDAGALDNIMYFDKGSYNLGSTKKIKLEQGEYVFDLKTGKSVDLQSHYSQLAAYGIMYEKLKGKKLKGGMIFWSNTKTKVGYNTYVIKRPELTKYYKRFRNAADLWEADNKNKEPKLFSFPNLISMS